MLCEKCGIREANIKYTEVFNGVKTEHNLCAQCAKEMDLGPYSALIEGEFPLGKLLSSLLGLTDASASQAPKEDVVCPTCGTTYEEFINRPNMHYDGTLPIEKRDDNEYELSFRNVSFRYPGTADDILKNVSLDFKIGQKMALVGMNGAGKTTLIKLLLRLYEPTGGEICLNGINIEKYDYEEYLQIFSVVFQDFKLFSFSLGQNVAAGIAYDRARAKACLEKAGFGARLQELPDGLDTCLYKDFEETGVEISGGEAQKIALARALYKDAPFIVLDEPTASLDPVAEYEVYSKFNDIVDNKTAIYISHRLSSCRFCDEIAVFDHGRIVQQGSHEELAADGNGKYYELWCAQSQYYNPSEP